MRTTLIRLALGAAVGAIIVLVASSYGTAAVTCPSSIPAVNENNCKGSGTSAWEFGDNYSESIAGYATQTSFEVGEGVPLKIARDTPSPGGTSVNIEVFRMGYYGGEGGRLVYSATNVAVNNNFTCLPPNTASGELSCSNWSVTRTIPASSLQVSGVYVAKLKTTGTSPLENQVVFVMRQPSSSTPSQVLVVLPTATYEAYNTWGGKSLYFDRLGGPETVSGTGRAVQVSFDRPLYENNTDRNHLFGPDREMIYWLEKQGYDVSYTDDVSVDQNGSQLLGHRVVLIPGHSEYWSEGEFKAFKAAREAGVSIASFSANTAYWKVRYAKNSRTLVCFKTVQGDGSGGSGSVTPNDWGPDEKFGTADDALGADGIAGTADDNPQYATTTWRDNGAPPGDPNAPPGGRVGPDEPENSLFGVMYVADNETEEFPLQIPPGNSNEEDAASRVWRNTGISQNVTTTIPGELVGWEWDAIPTQTQYLSREPAGVKRVAVTNVQALAQPGANSWLIDEGRQRSTSPPPGQPGTAEAVEYRAASGAVVFASGTMRWARGLEAQADPRIEQATYNILSEMRVQPATPTGITLDPGGSNSVPRASFTVSPNPVGFNKAVTFDGSASNDLDGSIVKYEWDLDGNGTYETSTGTSPTASRSYSSEGNVEVHLRVTDNGGATDTTTRTLEVIGNQAPVASFTANPNPAIQGMAVSFDASGSKDPDGSVVKYEWDLDGNGTYETSTGSTPTVSKAYTEAGTVQVGLRVTDNGGKTATTTLPLKISVSGVSSYSDAVENTPGLIHYWRMDETSGTTLADKVGGANATTLGEPTLGAPGGPAGDPDTSVHFDGLNDAARARVDLSSLHAITVEFWLNIDAYTNDDSLALELTENFNQNKGGFIVDPNAPQQGGTFGVGIGDGSARNNVFFTRPTAGQWHHYAFVLDSSAPAAEQIKPYVDGKPISYVKTESGTTAGTFANAFLNFMSRGGTSLFGRGSLDELAIYSRALSASEIAEHAASLGTNRRPIAAFTASPSPTMPGTTVTLDASGSTDPDGSIVKYEWDLDGNGTYETSTGSTPKATTSFATEGTHTVGLRVTDNQTGTDTTTGTIKVGPQPPNASFKAEPSPAVIGIPVRFDASGSNDPDGSVVKYEWDLDGNGTYETSTGSVATTEHSYQEPATYNVGLRVTDNSGLTATTIVPLTVTAGGASNYGEAVLGTPGLVSYWRMGEPSGPTLVDSNGVANGTASAGASFGVPGAIAEDPNTAVHFGGADFAKAPVNLSGTHAATVEFWLNLDAYTNDDALALELTENFNQNPGGFIVDPNAPQQGGTFGVGIGDGSSRNNVFFARPSAGQWHEYAFVLDSSAPAAEQIKPYVDGRPVSYVKTESGTNAGNFANSVLYMMSRAGQSLFARGSLDEVAVYKRALSASEIAEHFASHGLNKRPHAVIAASPNPAPVGTPVEFDASGSNDPDGTIQRYQWDLDGNGTFETDTGTTPHVTHTYSQEGQVPVSVRVYDNSLAIGKATTTLTVGSPPPPPPTVSYSQTVLNTPGLIHYWRFEESPGSTSLADSVGGATATLGGGPTLGLAGALGGSAGGFDGSNDYARAPVDLSGTSKLTVEFWLKWNAFADDDALAMELTENFNGNSGGLLIDPDASQGEFGVGIGSGESRNNVYFARPSAGQWHHYAFVLDSSAPAAEQIKPYVDGKPVAYNKGASGTGAGPFANAPLFMMSRAGERLFGAGTLDEVALYDQALSSSQIAEHFAANAP